MSTDQFSIPPTDPLPSAAATEAAGDAAATPAGLTEAELAALMGQTTTNLLRLYGPGLKKPAE